MERGRFWEVTYAPEWGPLQEASFADVDGSSGFVKRRIVSNGPQGVSVRWKAKGPKLHFQDCDIEETVHDSLVSNCTFTGCRFAGSTWTNVKFGSCRFENCDFSEAVFDRCYFVSDCEFASNSCSAELFRLVGTAISATSFIGALTTNLLHTNKASYQKHRFVRTKEKLAKSVFSSTHDEAEVSYYFEAYEQLVRTGLDSRVEVHRFDGDVERRRVSFFALSAPARVERRIVLCSGWLTQWGRSILRPVSFYFVTVSIFSFVYSITDPSLRMLDWTPRIASAVSQASNITLVAGYTSYFTRSASLCQQAVWTANVIVGIFWYSLLVPVMSRRTLR